MLAKGYHIQRLKPEVEENIRKILREGSDNVVKILHEHFKEFVPDDSEKIFEQVLIQIATTVSKVASLPELNFDQTKKKRIAFLPGYTTKGKKRVAHKVKFEKKFIPSDIAFNINAKEKIERVKETVTNQALLYYHLLEHHEDDTKFLNGGTHQFLIANATALKTKSKYHLDLLQVFTGKKNAKPQDEITFLTIEVDFKKLNTVEKLYNHFDKIMNEGNPELKWPLNIQDKKGDYSKKESTYKMRGYLVSLWYKILHDTNKKNIDAWFAECINFAEASDFQKLNERLQKLQKAITINNGEHYSYWYSLTYNHLPDFTTQDEPIKETLGSAMLMTNFELKPQFFFWVQPWVNRVYRNIRDFETLEKVISKTREQLKSVYTGDKKYLPAAVQGERLYKTGKDYKHNKPLIFYYQELFGKENEERNKIESTATKILDSINTLHLIQRTRKKGEERTNGKNPPNSIIELIDIAPIKLILTNVENVIEGFGNTITQNLPASKYGFNSLLTEPLDSENVTRFYFRMVGRLITLVLYSKCNYTVSQINSLLSQRKLIYQEPTIIHNENNFRICRSNFFIEGLIGGDDAYLRRDAAAVIQKHLSEFEKKFIESWHTDFQKKILSEKIIATDKENELKEILKLDYKYRL